ncbi:MAG: Glucokinase [Chlorobi bacterium]|nr:Glucokinase [Chlorobiota bacterium]
MILAMDIGGTKLALGVAGRDDFAKTGRLARIIKEPVPPPGTPEVVIPRLLTMSRELLGGDGVRLSAIGISIGGPLDHVSGTVVNFPHLPGWINVPLAGRMAAELGAPAALDNDANLGALAEHRWGGWEVHDMVYLTISTGIGGGIIVGGKLLHGIGSAAGEVGHITVQTGGPRCPCGNRGCLEMMASGTSTARRAREALEASPGDGAILRRLAGDDPGMITSALVLRAAHEGDRLAAEIWEGTAEYIAIGVGSIIHILAPQIVVLGGGVAQAGEYLLEPVRRRLRDHGTYMPLGRIRIEGARLGHDSALIGAATLALGN